MNAKFEGRVPDDQVNLPKAHPLKEAATLALTVFVVGLVVFASLGWLTEKLVLSMSPEMEATLLKPLEASLSMTDVVDTSSSAMRVEAVFEKVAAQWENAPYKFVLRVVKGEPNAFAVPGGAIMVTTGLISELQSENELAFILGHELGHFKNRDHLRGLSRGLSIAIIKLTAFSLAGVDASNTELLDFTELLSSRASGRGQELAADRFGLKLVNGALGHVAGADTFFERRMKEGGFSNTKVGNYFSTHPASNSRIKAMESLAEELGFSRTGTITAW